MERDQKALPEYFNDIENCNKSANEVLIDCRKFLEISDELKQLREFLTFHVGNLHFAANSFHIKKAVMNATGVPVDKLSLPRPRLANLADVGLSWFVAEILFASPTIGAIA